MEGSLEKFSPVVSARLTARIQSGPGRAVFDADHTLWSHDAGEEFYAWLVENRLLVNVDYARDLFADYRALEAVDELAAYAKLVTDMAGLTEQRVQELAARFFRERFQQRCYSAMRGLLEQLAGAGWEARIVTASNRWIVQAAAPHFGLAPEQVIGVDVHVEGGTLTDALVYELPYGPGKVKAIQRFVGHRPHLAAGDSAGDLYMLETAADLALVLAYPGYDKQRPLLDAAARRGWLVQNVPPA